LPIVDLSANLSCRLLGLNNGVSLKSETELQYNQLFVN